MAVVGALPLLRSFRLQVREPGLDEFELVSFAPLQSLPKLESLEVEKMSNVQFSHEQEQELRAMPYLRTLDVNFAALVGPHMARLLRRPHSLQWQSLGRAPLKIEHCALLPTLLPSVTELNFRMDSTTHVSFLTQLPNLRELQIEHTFARLGRSLPLERLPPALQSCTGLTKLTLKSLVVSAAHMSELIPRLPNLRELTLESMNHIDSLRFLSRGPITHTLTHLSLSSLVESWKLHTTELQHVYALKELRWLVIDQSFAEPLDPELLRTLSSPHCPLLPKLTHFSTRIAMHW